MNEMEKLLHELEEHVIKTHGTGMLNEMLKQGESSYSIKYKFGIDDNIGTLYMIATSKNALCISLFHGSELDERMEIYSTPFIYDLTTAKKMLRKIDAIINDSAYEAYCSNINYIAQTIKDTYNM